MPASEAPAGWPADLPPPTTEEFEEAVAGWLLDRCPPEARQSFTIRRHPLALAHVAARHSEAVVAGQREAYRAARRELAERLPAQALAGVLTDLEGIGHELVGTLREVRLVCDALQGRVWRPKL
jgi:hypothetical protein